MAEVKITQDNFESEVLKSDKPVLVDFFATWCGPCQMLMPIIEELSEEYDGKVKIATLDIDENQELAQKYQVSSVPSLVIFKDGEEVERMMGLQPKEILKEIKAGSQGIIITHGTDTIHYSSSALSFILEDLSKPVLIVGAQRSSDRGSSDAFINLLNAVYFIINCIY